MGLEKSRVSLRPDIHNFSPQVFGSLSELVNPPVSREKDTLIVACSELGTAPDNISFADRERFLILQHLAASMPSKCESERYGLSFDPVERLFDKYEFRYVVICGHLGSRVIPYWLESDENVEVTDAGKFRRRFESGTRRLVDSHYVTESSLERIRLMIFEHVLCQIGNLLTHPFILERVQTGRTSLFGWVIDDATARVYSYHAEQSAFELA